ncbi:hypothetical protein L2E82_11319 [Cichorium intybus]|uniref:Uncharacterized protein n=1 Tax=Cichorium intybus TaxID=13427 RepID=A0ACB9GCZ5_CICIN|nr:hypothetical protein L2E82_11319 [Cichorium intybus]
MATLQFPRRVPSPAQDCVTLRNAFQGSKTNEKAVIQVLAHRNAAQRKIIGDTYQELYNQSLSDSLNSKISDDFGILFWFINPMRYIGTNVDLDSVNDDATKLKTAIESKQIDTFDVAIIFSSRSFFALKAIFESYHKKYGNRISEDIKDSGNDMWESLLKTMIRCIVSPEKHLAEVIRAATSGTSTDHDTLIRVIVRRAEIDLMKVREAYLEMIGTSLDNAETRKHIWRVSRFLVYLYKVMLRDRHDVSSSSVVVVAAASCSCISVMKATKIEYYKSIYELGI